MRKLVNTALSSVIVFFNDHLGSPIKNLKVEIRSLGDQAGHNIYHAASTNAQGAIRFSVSNGEDVSVYVKRWTDDSMKEIARVSASMSQIVFRLTSPKTLHDLPTKTDKSDGGNYRRGTYVVKENDNLTVVAKRYHTSVAMLKHVNHLTSDLIRIGQVLKVPPVESRRSHLPVPRMSGPRGEPQSDHDYNNRGAPTTTPRNGVAPIIFPVKVRPLNDEGSVYGTAACNYTWSKPLGSPGSQQARFGANRGGGSRKHAARDLYLHRYTDIIAIAPGVVMKCEPFYCQTNQISIHHTTIDGRQFIALYGEVDPDSINVRVGDHVAQGDVLGKSGVLMKPGGIPLHVVGNQNVSMLHFEAYSGAAGFDSGSRLNGSSLPAPFHRRSDLFDSITILQEGYRATFLDAIPLRPIGDRTPICQLSTSSRGKEFIKGWEGVKYDAGRANTFYYDDSKGYCTVGWGHLVDRRNCTSLGFTPLVSKMALEEADLLFDKDVLKHEAYVKEVITAPLYQNEFDALVSLAFNCGHIGRVAPNLCRKVNDCNYAQASVEFLDMENEKRRRSERNIFCDCVYDSSH